MLEEPCPTCGHLLEVNERVCPACGLPRRRQRTAQQGGVLPRWCLLLLLAVVGAVVGWILGFASGCDGGLLAMDFEATMTAAHSSALLGAALGLGAGVLLVTWRRL